MAARSWSVVGMIDVNDGVLARQTPIVWVVGVIHLTRRWVGWALTTSECFGVVLGASFEGGSLPDVGAALRSPCSITPGSTLYLSLHVVDERARLRDPAAVRAEASVRRVGGQ
jgi:hypothetical protein